MYSVKLGKSCDECKARKVKCTKTEPSDASCTHCLRRGTPCHFNPPKKRQRQRQSQQTAPPAEQPTLALSSNRQLFPSRPIIPTSDPLPLLEVSGLDVTSYSPSETPGPRRFENAPLADGKLFMDLLLEDRKLNGRQIVHSNWFKANDHYAVSCSITFFSATRVASLCKKLANNRFKTIIDTIDIALQAKVDSINAAAASLNSFNPSLLPEEPEETRRAYIRSYFDEVHPIYPFLDQERFEKEAFDVDYRNRLRNEPAWAGLYYAVLCHGSQYHGGASFVAGRGKAWNYFQAAISLLPQILVSKLTLTNIHAVLAMATYSLNFAGMQLDDFLVTEAARLSRVAQLHKVRHNDIDNQSASKTFWIVYCLEKDFAFDGGKTSIIADWDIGCPIPEVPDAQFGQLNWLLTYARLARLWSRASEILFSVSSTLNTKDAYYQKIDLIRTDLEQWKATLPEQLREDKPFRPYTAYKPGYTQIALTLRLVYHNFNIALARLTLHVGGSDSSPRQIESIKLLTKSARAILDLMKYVELEPYTNTRIQGTFPLVSMFILFDFVIHNPKHPETKTNLAFLDVAAGHFSRLELASEGAFPCLILSEFTHIARQHVQDIISGKNPSPPDPTTEHNIQKSATLAPNSGHSGDSSVTATTYCDTDMFNQIEMPEWLLAFPDVDMSLPFEEQNVGFDVMGLFGSTANLAAPIGQPPFHTKLPLDLSNLSMMNSDNRQV